jgi:AraC-like DNA-binding protein
MRRRSVFSASFTSVSQLSSLLKVKMPEFDQALSASPLRSILFVKRLQRTSEEPRSFQATSLPGHLLHFVLEGRVAQECNGRYCELSPGSVLWYHEDELVRGEALELPWTWYSINFIAPDLPPPPFEARLWEGQRKILGPQFDALWQCWNGPEPSLQRLLRGHSLLLEILSVLLASQGISAGVGEPSQLWWVIESELRKDLSRPISLDVMRALSGRSAATVARSCYAATGTSPMQRIKQVRLSLARGLVQRSTRSLTQIAEEIGYPRLHEFSRDFKRHFGVTASEERKRWHDDLKES